MQRIAPKAPHLINPRHRPKLIDPGDGKTLGFKVGCSCGWEFVMPPELNAGDAQSYIQHHVTHADHPEYGPTMAGDPRAAMLLRAEAERRGVGAPRERTPTGVWVTRPSSVRPVRRARQYPGVPPDATADGPPLSADGPPEGAR